MEFLYLLESLRCGILDALFSIITILGEETAFMLVGMTVFWCVSKYEGYCLLCTGFFGTLVNQFLKILCRVPRPWVRDPNFTIVESAREAATGYSFPSGHTQNAITTFGGLARWHKQTAIRTLAIAACVLVPLSRMYLGVHTPADVLVSIGFGLLLVFVGYPLVKKAEKDPRVMYAMIGTMALLTLAYLIFVNTYAFPADTDAHNLLSARKNGATLMGCLVGLILVYTADLRFIHFETKAVWWAQILKVVGGILLVFLVKELLRSPLEAIFGNEFVARGVRYFLMVIVGGGLWPMTFGWFSRLGQKKESK